MKILKGIYIEFGDFKVNGQDEYPIAIVHGDYEIKHVNQQELDKIADEGFDWINLDAYQGEIYYSERKGQ